MNPFYTAAAFLGGRSLKEAGEHEAHELSTSIAIGVANMLSSCIILAGQYLFWLNIPTTAPAASWIASGLCVIYTSFYRLLIRASEVMGGFGKSVVFACGGTLVMVNAMLAGHELVLIPFAPQVAEMVTLNGSRNVGMLRTSVETAKGLGPLRDQAKQQSEEVNAARALMDTVPERVKSLGQEADQCERQAQAMQRQLPPEESDTYATARAQWAAAAGRCRNLRNQAAVALREHLAETQAALRQAQQKKARADASLGKAQGELDDTIQRAAPVLQTAAASGFARHAALWDTVREGKIPLWAAIGLMAVALVLEGAGFFLKFLLPADAPSHARFADAQSLALEAAIEKAFMKAMRKQVAPAANAYAGQAHAELTTVLQKSVWPSMRTRMAASQFVKAWRSTRTAQSTSQQAATPVVEQLAAVSPVGA